MTAVPKIDELLDRGLQPGYRSRARRSRLRRVAMPLLLAALLMIIGGYWHVTNSDRVRRMAERTLSRQTGGVARVESATISIFEGLRLRGVSIFSSESELPIFTADTLTAEYSPASLVRGTLDFTRVVAVAPRVRLEQNLDTGNWNFDPLLETFAGRGGAGSEPPTLPDLPEVVLRDARITYVQNFPGRRPETGQVAIEGLLTPGAVPGRYRFHLQSRAQNTLSGPVVSGEMQLDTGQVDARLMNIGLGRDMQVMLPSAVRAWWRSHGIEGKVDVPRLIYLGRRDDGSRGFEAEIRLDGVRLQVQPDEWMGRTELKRRALLGGAMVLMRHAGLNGAGFVTRAESFIRADPLKLNDVRGSFVFSDDRGIELKDVVARLEDHQVMIDGLVGGYGLSPTINLQVSNLPSQNIVIPESPRYLSSLPAPVREIYDRFKPQGSCAVALRLVREAEGAPVHVEGRIEVLKARFAFEEFPYPVHDAAGVIVLGREPSSGDTFLRVEGIRGRGDPRGPNREAWFELRGLITPLTAESRVEMKVIGENIVSEPALHAAFPRRTREALKYFDAPGRGEFPRLRGGFTCDVVRKFGIESHWTVDTDIRLDGADAMPVSFPYLLSGLRGNVIIHDDSVDVVNMTMKRGESELVIDGRITWDTLQSEETPDRFDPQLPDRAPRLVKPDLTIRARNVPIDEDLLAALPPGQRRWISSIGLGGVFDVDGKLVPPSVAGEDTGYDLNLTLRDGVLWPVDGRPVLRDVAGSFKVTPQRLEIHEARGMRQECEVRARGSVDTAGDSHHVELSVEADDLPLNSDLRAILPGTVRDIWDMIRPQGRLDLRLHYSGTVEAAASDDPAGGEAANPGQHSKQAQAVEGEAPAGLAITLVPRGLSVTPTFAPYRLDDVTGVVRITGDRVELREIEGRHAGAKVTLSGTGGTGPASTWSIRLAGRDVAVDEELLAALPSGVAETLRSLQVKGTTDFEFTRLQLLPGDLPETRSDGFNGTIDFAINLITRGWTLDVGVPMTEANGRMQFEGSGQGGKMRNLTGSAEFPSVRVAGLPVKSLRARFSKPQDLDLFQVQRLQAEFAGGELAGQLDVAIPEKLPSRYVLGLVLRNADVATLTGESPQTIHGQLTASLALEGTYNDPSSRRGRGDVSVQGEELYRIPLILSLVAITNLSLPITSPFSEAAARYTIDGGRVSFEKIELRAKEMLMQGSGHLDFANKTVRLTFVTESPAWLKLPIVGDLIQGARNELLQIQVRGTIQEPKVSAGMMQTVTTTIDEVFRSHDSGR